MTAARSDAAGTGEGGVVGAGSRRRWWIAVILFGAVVSGFIDRISVAVLFSNHDFNAAMGTNGNPAMLGALMTAFLVPYGASAFFLSVFGDVFGPRRGLTAIAGVWGVLMLLMGSAGSYALMLTYRVLLGITEGPQFSFILKTVRVWFPAKEHGRANAIWLTGSPIGSAVGFPMMIALVAALGWRASFYALGLVNLLIVLPLIMAFVRDRPEGAVAAAARPQGSFWADCGLFLRNWQFWLLTNYDCAVVMYLWGLNSWLPSYLGTARHFNLQALGIFSSLPFVLTFLGEIASGVLADRVRRSILCLVGLLGAGVFMLCGAVVANPYEAAVLIALSSGCWGLTVPAVFAILLQMVPQSVAASATGVFNGIANTVGSLAPLAMGILIGATGRFDAGLFLLVGASLVGSVALVPLLRRY